MTTAPPMESQVRVVPARQRVEDPPMQVKLTQDQVLSPDGVNVVEYEAGSVLDLPTAFAHRLIDAGRAVDASDEPRPEPKAPDKPAEVDDAGRAKREAERDMLKGKQPEADPGDGDDGEAAAADDSEAGPNGCHALTKAGNPCKGKAVGDSAYCKAHAQE